MPAHDTVVDLIIKRDFVSEQCKVVQNRERRASVMWGPNNSRKNSSEYSFISQVGEQVITKQTPCEKVVELISRGSDYTEIVVMHATRFCVNQRCGRPSSYFVDRERQGHSTCTGCGTVQRLCQNKFSLRLTDDGVANKSQWNHTPGMSHRDCQITTRKGRMLCKKPKSHQRNKWRIRRKIEDILHEKHFMAIESIIRCAKAKLDIFYRHVHPDDEDEADNQFKLPHGGAALAAACVYCSVLEFESRVGYKTPCTLPALQESAQQCRDQKQGRKCRDVTNEKILRYSKLLRKHELCSVEIPTIGAESLLFHPKDAALQHARMALFSDCYPVKFHLRKDESWGLKVRDTKQGVLTIDSCDPNKMAWKIGIRKEDYIFQVGSETIDISYTLKKFETTILELKKIVDNSSVLQLTIMRKKKK